MQWQESRCWRKEILQKSEMMCKTCAMHVQYHIPFACWYVPTSSWYSTLLYGCADSWHTCSAPLVISLTQMHGALPRRQLSSRYHEHRQIAKHCHLSHTQWYAMMHLWHCHIEAYIDIQSVLQVHTFFIRTQKREWRRGGRLRWFDWRQVAGVAFVGTSMERSLRNSWMSVLTISRWLCKLAYTSLTKVITHPGIYKLTPVSLTLNYNALSPRHYCHPQSSSLSLPRISSPRVSYFRRILSLLSSSFYWAKPTKNHEQPLRTHRRK